MHHSCVACSSCKSRSRHPDHPRCQACGLFHRPRSLSAHSPTGESQRPNWWTTDDHRSPLTPIQTESKQPEQPEQPEQPMRRNVLMLFFCLFFSLPHSDDDIASQCMSGTDRRTQRRTDTRTARHRDSKTQYHDFGSGPGVIRRSTDFMILSHVRKFRIAGTTTTCLHVFVARTLRRLATQSCSFATCGC